MNNESEFPLPGKPYSRSVEEIQEDLNTSVEGLSPEQAGHRLELFGTNQLPEAPRDPWFIRFARHFHDTLIYVLLGAAAITGVLQHWVDTGVILGVVVINAIIGFIQEGKAEKALAGIRKMLSTNARVLRQGRWTEIEADQLVPGDIVALKSGNRVPADLRLSEVVNLRIEESALTGESVPSECWRKKPLVARPRPSGSLPFRLNPRINSWRCLPRAPILVAASCLKVRPTACSTAANGRQMPPANPSAWIATSGRKRSTS